MGLIIILGPMKSGKSLEFISHFSPLRYANVMFGVFQPEKNTRDEQIWARDGLEIEAKKIKTLFDVVDKGFQVVGVDEIHMFPEKDAAAIEELLKKNTKVVVSALDMDYQRKMFDIVKELLCLGPDEVRYKKAVCEICRRQNAVYTQIFKDDLPIFKGLPPVVPDDGTYIYKPVCRFCFKEK